MAVRFAPWPGLVDDIFQQVFLEFMSGADRFDLQQDSRPLLITITRRIALQHWKHSIRHQSEPMQQLANHIRQVANERGNEVCWEEEAGALQTCLERLPRESRQLLDLYYFQEVSTDAIGRRLSMKPDTVRRAISRLRKRLRDCIQFTLNLNTSNV